MKSKCEKIWVITRRSPLLLPLSADCLKAIVHHYSDKTCSHDSDSQEPLGNTGSLLQSYSITHKWTGAVEMGHDNKCHPQISPAAGSLQGSNLQQKGWNQGWKVTGMTNCLAIQAPRSIWISRLVFSRSGYNRTFLSSSATALLP